MSTNEDLYAVLGAGARARHEEVEAAFEDVLAARKARRSKTSDVRAAFAVLGDVNLRRTYDLTRLGRVASERLCEVAASSIEVLPDANWSEVANSAVQVGLKSTVLISGATAKVADVVGTLSRRVQVMAAKRITSAK
jgi:hypothetical protein